jgi:hypothetical protein
MLGSGPRQDRPAGLAYVGVEGEEDQTIPMVPLIVVGILDGAFNANAIGIVGLRVSVGQESMA